MVRAPSALLLLALALTACGGGGSAAAGATAAPVASGSSPSAPRARPLAPLHTAGRFIRDDEGRVVLLRGVNYSEKSKRPPFTGWHHPGNAALFKECGFGVVRYLLTWEAVEPTRGNYDQAYLADVRQQLDLLEAAGVRVILDFHQDLWARTFGGDGAPAWATQDDPLFPNTPLAFPANYVNPDVLGNFHRFFRDASLKAAYRDAWLAAINALSSSPAVIGYDLMNEPFVGFELPWNFDQGTLSDFYEFLLPPLQAADPDRLFFVEPNPITGFGLGPNLRPLPFPNLVYAPHWYDPVVDVRLVAGQHPYDGQSKARTRVGLDAHVQQAARMGVPWFLGEFGTNVELADGATYVRDHVDLLNDLLVGGALWEWNANDPHDWSPVGPGLVEKAGLPSIARPYPVATAGTPTRVVFDEAARTLEVTFDEDSLVTPGALTEIALAARWWFPAGLMVESSDPPGTWAHELDPATGRLLVRSDPASPTHTIRVRAR
jgi:endoglycosylceramidase